MRVFISWSGERSSRVAKALRTFLEDVNQRIEPWMSEVDIRAGSRWGATLAIQLEKTEFGIICLTPEALASPWLVFEAGALSKSVQEGRVCPYLIGLDKDSISGPLTQFQVVEATREGTFRLLNDINKASKNEAIAEPRLERYFEQFWPNLEDAITHVNNDKEADYQAVELGEEYDNALREFRIIDPTLDEMGRLKSKQVNEYYRNIGVYSVFEEVFGSDSVRDLHFIFSIGRNAPPVWGAGDVRYLAAYHRYFLLMDGWEWLDVFEMDCVALREVLLAFKKKHPEIASISKLYVSYNRPEGQEDPYFIPETGYAELLLVKEDDGTIIETLEVPYSKAERLKPEPSISLAKDRGLVIENDKQQKEALPALRRVWDVVGDLDMGVIEGALSRRLREARR